MWVSVERYLFNKVYNKLKSNLIIQKQLDGRVFDCVQKDAVYPYIVVGETNVTNKETTTSMVCLLYTSPSPRDMRRSRMPSSA
ncbi:hypothetical protein JMUB7526_28370 [Staphylococcus aureus]